MRALRWHGRDEREFDLRATTAVPAVTLSPLGGVCVYLRKSIMAVCLKSNRSQPLDKKVMFLSGKIKFEVKSEPLD